MKSMSRNDAAVSAVTASHPITAPYPEDRKQRDRSVELMRELKSSPTEALISTVHYANRLLRRRDLVSDPDEGLVIEGLEGEPDVHEAELAQSLVKQFAEREGTRLQDMSDSRAEHYIKLLSRLARRRAQHEYPISSEQAVRVRELLRLNREIGEAK